MDKTLVEWRRTAFPGRHEYNAPRDGLGRSPYEASSMFTECVTDLKSHPIAIQQHD